MGYLIKAILGAALFIGGVVLFNVKLIGLLEVGTCASGNQPFVVARECPSGIGTDILLMSAAIIGGLFGAALFAFRGDPPWASGRDNVLGGFSWGTLAWGIFFAGSGAVILLDSLTDDSLPSDGKLGGTIVGITFVVMGVPALLFAAWMVATNIADRDEGPAPATGSTGGLGGYSPSALSNAGSGLTWAAGAGSVQSGRGTGASISQLERLQQLRDNGVITEKEFEREKAKILSG